MATVNQEATDVTTEIWARFAEALAWVESCHDAMQELVSASTFRSPKAASPLSAKA
jgi:hypothetical protein